jgi:DNA-binding CsgD family transcriptional regulator
MSERLPTRLPEVTPRQREVARLIAEGYTNERIAQELGITHDGAKYHVSELLGRLGFERREQVAAWYQAQERRPLRERMRTLVGTPLAWGAGGVAAIAAVALLIAAFEGALLGGGDAEGDVASPGLGASGPIELPEIHLDALPPVAEYVHEHSGDGWESRAAADLGERDLLFLLYFVAIETEIHAIDRATGERVGEVSAGMRRELAQDGTPTGTATAAGNSPLIAYARGNGRLIFSDRVWEFAPDQEQEERVRILLFDISDGLALEAELELPGDRDGGHATIPSELGRLLLSGDERYLYYVAGGSNVGIIDLEDGPRNLDPIPLPDGCSRDGAPSLFPSGASSVIATCPGSGVVRTIAPDGAVGADIDAAGLSGFYDEEGWEQLPILVPVALDTRRGMMIIYHDGNYALADGSTVSMHGRVLPPERMYTYYTWRSEFLVLDDARLAIPYHNEWPFHPDGPPRSPDGLVVFNIETESIEADIEIEHRGSYPLNDREIALVNEGRIDILDLTTMTIVQSFGARHPDRPEVLPALR